MRALILAMLFAPAVVIAQQPGLEIQGPVANYVGYAFLECSASNVPAVRVVALQGLVPEGVPKTPPRPSLELIINSGLEAAIGKPITVAPKSGSAAGNAMVLSCPVVGDCAAADTGVLTITGKADNGNLLGEFRAKWANGAPRAGKFTVNWRDSQAKCG